MEGAVGKQQQRSCHSLGEGVAVAVAVLSLEKMTPLAMAAESVANWLGSGWGEARAVFGKMCC